MLDSYARPIFQRLVIDRIPFVWNTSPLLLTFMALLSGISAAWFFAWGYNYLGLVFLLFSGLFDLLDGSVARRRGLASPLGAVCDIISDRLVEFALILGLSLVDFPLRGLYGMWMLGAAFLCVTSFLVVGVFAENRSEKSFHYSPGLMERGEAFLFFGAMGLFPSLFPYLSVGFSLLVFYTALRRVWEFASTL